MALRNEFGDDAWPIFDEWSRPAENYNARENKSRWSSFKSGGGITIASVYGMARDAGWRDDGTYRMPDPEELAARTRVRAEAEAEQRKERESTAVEAAKKASAILSIAPAATADNPYCRRKGIGPADTLREIDADRAAVVLGYVPSAKGEKLHDRLLMVPIKVRGKLSSLQLIDGAGRKHFLANGTIGGGYWATHAVSGDDGTGLTVLAGEGVATVTSAAAVLPGALGIAAMMNSNIPAVARLMRERYPHADVVILADIGKEAGEPDKYAVEAAGAISGRLAIPRFADGPARDRKDFNDMARLHGVEAVRKAIETAQTPSYASGANGADAWTGPQPLVSKIEPEAYPLDALPDGIREAVAEVATYMRAPVPLVASGALSALSLTCQHHVDVRRDARLCGPTSLFFLTIADSGERKTSVDGMFMAPLREWQRRRADEMKPEVDTHSANHAAWLAECDGVRAAIKDAAKTGKSSDHLKKRLVQLQQCEPRGPRVPWLFLGDETPENLAWRLHAQWPSAGLISSEAGVVFGGHGMGPDKALGYLTLLNVLWDGGEHSVGRKTSASFILRAARLTAGLQVQEAALLEFVERTGRLARGTGFFARFLTSWPRSTQGTREYREPERMPSLEAFQARLAALLERPVTIQDDGVLKPLLAHLGTDAKQAWIGFHDAIEKALGEGGELRDVRDVASKAAENAARLSALFQVYATDPTATGLEVKAEAFDRAGRIVAWHLSESRRFFGQLALPDDLAAAAKLDAWLIDHCRRERCTAVPKNHVRQCGPGHLRDSKRLDAALKVLTELDRVRVTTGRPAQITVNPALLGGAAS